MEKLKEDNKLSGLERVHKIHLDIEPFSPENGILTPTLKLKRHDAKKKYIAFIREMYGGAALQGEDENLEKLVKGDP